MKRKTTIHIAGNLLALLMLVTACYREDISPCTADSIS